MNRRISEKSNISTKSGDKYGNDENLSCYKYESLPTCKKCGKDTDVRTYVQTMRYNSIKFSLLQLM